MVLLYPGILPGTLKGTVKVYVQGLVTDGGGCPNSKLFGLVDRHTAGCLELNWLFQSCYWVQKPRRCFSSPLWFCVQLLQGVAEATQKVKKKHKQLPFSPFCKPLTTPLGARRYPHCAPCGSPFCGQHSSASG